MEASSEQQPPAPSSERAAGLVGRTLLGRLRVVRRLGEGGTGAVYEVEHLLTKHRRALKVLHGHLASSAEAAARLVREAAVAGRLDSPFVAETYDAGRLDDGSAFVLMELVRGQSLRAVLEANAQLDPVYAVTVVAQVCEGLSAVHAEGMIHRDLKPEHVMLTIDARGAQRVKILDFGLLAYDPAGAGDAFGALTQPGRIPGTPAYLAPEQIEQSGRIDARTDVHAAGVILYEAIAGRRPFVAPTVPALLLRIGKGDHPPLRSFAPDVDADLEAIVHRAMHRDSDVRHPSATALRQDLLSWSSARAASIGSGARTGGLPALAGRYDIVRCIGTGGMGAVYEAVHRETRRRCALKLMLPALAAKGELRERFALEAVAAAAVESEHIVDVLDAGVDAETGAPYLVMELLRGEDVGAAIAQRGTLSAREVCGLVAQAARGLDATHTRGIVHRDLKPENLFVVRRKDGEPLVKLLDFGLAKVAYAAGRDASATAGLLGTPLYIAPEQMERSGAAGPAADRYALAHIAFTALTGEAYWADEAHEGFYVLLEAIASGAPEAANARAARRGHTLPRGFDRWFAKATSREPAARHQSAADLARELAEALGADSTLAWHWSDPALHDTLPGGEPEAATPTDLPLVPHARRGTWLAAGLAAVGLVFAGLLWAARASEEARPGESSAHARAPASASAVEPSAAPASSTTLVAAASAPGGLATSASAEAPRGAASGPVAGATTAAAPQTVAPSGVTKGTAASGSNAPSGLGWPAPSRSIVRWPPPASSTSSISGGPVTGAPPGASSRGRDDGMF